MPPTDETGEVTLFNSECRRGVLPEVCVRCGAQTRRVKRMTFGWTPPWTYALWLLGPLGMAMTLGTRWQRAAFLPVCTRHNSSKQILAAGLFLCAAFSLFAGLGGLGAMGDHQGRGSDYARAAIGVTALVVVATGMAAGFAIGRSDIRAVEITETRMVLTHVHLDFIDALEDDRDRDDDYYEARRAGRRPGRDRSDERGR